MAVYYLGSSANVAEEYEKVFIGSSSNLAEEYDEVYLGNASNVAELYWKAAEEITAVITCDSLGTATGGRGSSCYIITGSTHNVNSNLNITMTNSRACPVDITITLSDYFGSIDSRGVYVSGLNSNGGAVHRFFALNTLTVTMPAEYTKELIFRITGSSGSGSQTYGTFTIPDPEGYEYV